MFVMRYYENGSLYSYLDEFMGILCWRDIVDMLWAISVGLNFIHERNLIHGHLHGGNKMKLTRSILKSRILDYTDLLINKYHLDKYLWCNTICCSGNL